MQAISPPRPVAGLRHAAAAFSLALIGMCGATAAEACPDAQLEAGTQLSYGAEEIFDSVGSSHYLDGGGPVDVSACDLVEGRGWVAEAPNYAVTITSNPEARNVEFSAGSLALNCTPVLVVRDPAGDWHFNHIARGQRFNSRLTFHQAEPGTYTIWVGTIQTRPCALGFGIRSQPGTPQP